MLKINLMDEKLIDQDIIYFTDSLNAPLLELEIKNNSNTIVPNTNELIIYIDKEEELTEERKQFVFELSSSLRYYDSVSDEFIIKPYFKNSKVEMKVFVKRLITEENEELSLLDTEEIEEISYQTITLFEGTNYIYTNYSDATIEIVYPKNNDINNRYLSNSIFNEYILNNEEDYSDYEDIKNHFTVLEDDINISANNLNINCITSKQNNFSLDSEGNLSVNSITSNEGNSTEINYDEIFDLVYPVDSIYLSVSPINPSTLFGGSWEEWGSGKVAIGVDTTQTEFNTVEKTGGVKTHNHTSSAHTHGLNGANAHACINKYSGRFYMRGRETSAWTSNDALDATNYSTNRSNDFSADVFGSTQSVTPPNTGESINLPPYITCYMWKRTS